VLYVGRILFGGYFIMAGLNHFAKLQAMAGYAQAKGVPASKMAVGGTGILLLVGGLSTLFNFYPAIGLGALFVFLIPTTFLMHAFWKIEDPMAKMGEQVNFMKNLALLGGTLILLSGVLS
jgi:putative oxidoreductase